MPSIVFSKLVPNHYNHGWMVYNPISNMPFALSSLNIWNSPFFSLNFRKLATYLTSVVGGGGKGHRFVISVDLGF
jgi:hypothetical protein